VIVADELRERGRCLTSARALSWPAEWTVLDTLYPALVPDPRAPGKQHARDVISYDGPFLDRADSIAFTTEAGEVIDDFSRFDLLKYGFGVHVVSTLLDLLPPEDRQAAGVLTADLFHYEAGIESAAHRDGFAAYVVIWVLARRGSGGESFLIRDSQEVLTCALEPGEVLIFRDELFLHGVRAMREAGASRDVLIFIVVKP
jgi:hypothetical protein